MSNPIIDIALKEIGYTESPANSNRTKYGAWFGFDGVPWCAMFVSWCYAEAGHSLGNIGFEKGYCGCQTALDHFTKSGEIIPYETAVPGDIFLVDWNRDGRFDHTGMLVEKVNGVDFITVEGNTSATNQSNGGEVQKRVRHLDKANFVFIHPKK